MEISVVVSAYERPWHLERVLRGYAVQTDPDFELLVADDGSGEEVRTTIGRVSEETGREIVHVWHADEGFRKTRILNRSIVVGKGEYLVFTDGDCVPRDDLVATHRALARPGRYLAGGYLKLPGEVSEAIGVAEVEDGRVTDLAWLRSRGWRPGRRALRLTRSPRWGALFDLVTPTAADFHGNNASVWRRDLEAVNGFEGKMGYGGLDKELGYRLRNLGVKGRQARHRAVAVHLHHDRPYREPETLRRNRERMARIRASGQLRAEDGLSELGPDRTLRIERYGEDR